MTTRSTRLDVAHVIAHDGADHRLVHNGSVIYTGDTVTYAGPRTDQPADVVEDLPDGLLCPGFLSLHNHLSFGSIDRSFREDCRSEHFYGSTLFEYVLPMMRAIPEALSAATTRLSMAELLLSGVTTCLDVTDSARTSADAAGQVGLRTYVGQAFTSYLRRVQEGGRISYAAQQPTPDRELVAQAVDSALDVDRTFGDLVRALVSPGAVDTCRPELLAHAARAARAAGLPLTTHCGQSRMEFAEIMHRHGCTPVALLDRVGFLGADVILAHCVFIDSHSRITAAGPARDLELLGRSGTTVAHCPTQFARTGTLLENFGRYQAAGVHIGLSTDAAPQCMFQEMRLAAILSRHSPGGEPAGAGEVFRAATTGAATALGRTDLGRISPGAKADLVLFRTDTPRLTPLRDPLKSIVYHAGPQDVARVIVAGREVVRDGRVVNVDVAALAAQVQDVCRTQVWPRIGDGGADDLAPMSLRPWHSSASDPAAIGL